MKVELWKEGLLKVIAVCLGLFLCTAGIIALGIVLALHNNLDITEIIIGILVLAICYVESFIRNPFVKVIISETGITSKLGKKQINVVDWYDITDVKLGYFSYALQYLSFVGDNTRLDIGLSQKLFDTIMDICPNNYIKNKLKDLPQLKYLKKTWEEKQENKQ